MSNGQAGHERWRGTQEEKVQQNEQRLENHDQRLTKLEKFKSYAKGGLSVLALIAGVGGIPKLLELLV